MNFTIFSFIMSVLWCDIFTILFYVFIHKKKLVMNLSVYPLVLFIILCFSRLALNIEFPLTTVIHSNTIYPKIVAFFDAVIIQTNSVTINIFDLFLDIWIFGSICSLLKIWREDRLFKNLMSHEKQTEDKRIYNIMDSISNGKSSNIKIIKTTLIDIPMISGLRKPTIYLPNTDLTDIELYHILLHEWTHYIHKDLWTKLLVKILCVIFWWNPFIYLLKYNIDNTLEIKSDLYLTHSMTDKEKFDYLETILKIARNLKTDTLPTSLSSIGFITLKNEHPLKQRFEYVLEYNRSNTPKKKCAILSMIMIFLFIGSYFFVVQPNSLPEEYELGVYFEITPENSFLIKNDNGTYSLFVNDTYKCNIDNIAEEPFSLLEIKKMEE